MNSGKIICEELKRIRKEVAEANGITYEPTHCNFEGECSGTCHACEAELKELTLQLKQKDKARIKGISKIVAASAMALSLAACATRGLVIPYHSDNQVQEQIDSSEKDIKPEGPKELRGDIKRPDTEK